MERSVWLFSAAGVKILWKEETKNHQDHDRLTFHTRGNGGTEEHGSAKVILAGQQSWEEPGTGPKHCSVLSHPVALVWTQQDGCKSVDLHLGLSFLFSPWCKQNEQTSVWSTGNLFMGNVNDSFAISPVNKAWRWFLELQYPHICYHRVLAGILQNSKNN